jgi:hypothetical protein
LELNPTGEDNSIDEISRIEARIEELAIAGGVALVPLMTLGLFGSNQISAVD